MDASAIITTASLMLNKARLSLTIEDTPGCISELAQLRKFLNEQPELEAGFENSERS